MPIGEVVRRVACKLAAQRDKGAATPIGGESAAAKCPGRPDNRREGFEIVGDDCDHFAPTSSNAATTASYFARQSASCS